MKTKILLLTVLAVLTLSQAKADTSYWDGSSWSTNWYYSGSGTVYHLKTAEDLAGFSRCFSQGYYMFGEMAGYTIILDNDIDLNGYEWTPIGIVNANRVYCSFGGTFDGNGHSIKGLHISNVDSYRSGVGLFGVIYDPNVVIKNLKVSGDISITPTDYDNTSYGIGGIVGSIQSKNVQIDNCTSNVDITVNYGTSMVNNQVGGIVGNIYLYSSTEGVIKRCSYSGSIIVNSANANKSDSGGIVGYDSQTPVSECSSTAIINGIGGHEFIGGVVGQSGSDSVSVSDCFYQGTISGSATAIWAGGISGCCKNIRNCVTIPTFVTNGGYAYLDPIEVMYNSDYKIENCYYQGASGNYGTYISESELKNGNPLSGFDTDIWTFEAGNYPVLSFSIHKYKVYVNTEHGIFGSLVKDGGNVNLCLDCDEGWTISNLYVNDVDCTSMVNNNVLTLKDVTEDKHVSIIYANQTNISALKEEKGSVSVKEGKLILTDFSNKSRAFIYNTDGELLQSIIINSEESIDLPKGIYIIKVGMKSFKVAL